jgi:cytochrome c553
LGLLLFELVTLVISPTPVAADEPPLTPEETRALEFFESQVRPLLVDRCFTCHSADTNSHGGLRVDDRQGLLTGGGRGPALVPGAPDQSLLLRAVKRTDDKLKMPPEKPLEESEVQILERWIAAGAPWTKVRIPSSLGQRNEEFEQLRKEHWAWQPLTRPAVPDVGLANWPLGDIDRFVLAKLEQRGLAPVAEADKTTRLRRLSFDLTGLPPTPEALEAFLQDDSPQAYERVVTALLDSPGYAERWARHWLDVARYGESTGSARNLPFPHAWRYRDYVIRAFETDKPYDVFVREQIAGDLLPANSPGQKAEQLIATGFLAVGVKDVNQRFKVRYLMDNVDEQIDTVSRALLGLTVSCARCHDHKFDPISLNDYYGLAGIFRSTDLCAGLRNKMGGGGLDYYDTDMLLSIGLEDRPLARHESVDAARKELQAAQAELRKVNQSGKADEKTDDGRTRRQVARAQVDAMQQKVLNLSDPAQHGPIALGVRDARQVADTEIRIRGEAEKLGPVVPRGVPNWIPASREYRVHPRQSGRLELADWLTDPENPLTSRVMVNRVWLHLFGRGLVKTPDNFGTTGDLPSHPELLDHLARHFVAEGWSVKKLVRQIVLSRAYRLGSEATSQHLALDPDNTLVWRHSPRRLEAEELRDATLAIAGQLVPTRPEGSPVSQLKVIEIGNNGAEAKKLAEFARASRHRSLFLPLVRTQVPQSLAAWDFAEQGFVTGSRDATTVAPQALYQLNDGFVREQARALAERVLATADEPDRDRVVRAWRLVLGRAPAESEVSQALEYLTGYVAALRELAPPVPDRPETPLLPDEQPPPAPAPPQLGEGAAPQGVPDLDRFPRLAWDSLCHALLSTAEFRYLR